MENSKTYFPKGKGNGMPESSQVAGISYDEANKAMTVTYRNNKSYSYQDIPESLFQQALSAPSIGAFLAEKVKNIFSFTKLN